MWVDFFSLICHERGAPKDWRWTKSSRLRELSDRDNGAFLVEGSIPGAVFSRGPKKGKPNPAKYTDKRQFVITLKDYDARKVQWERDNGICSSCEDGQQVVGYHVEHGKTYAPCKRCKGTGKFQEAPNT